MAEYRNTKSARRCPICKAESLPAYQPFCSLRCSNIDLGKWLANGYAMPGTLDDEETTKPIEADAENDDNGR